MTSFLRFWFWPNPGFAEYNEPSMLALMGLCALLIVVSFAISLWRKYRATPNARKLSGSWSATLFWFGVAGLIMVVARVEDIQFLSMRALWLIWTAILAFYVFFQFKRWRMRHYELLPTLVTHDPRDPYLPKKKKK